VDLSGPDAPLTPTIEHYEGEPAIPAVTVRTPSYQMSVDVQ